MKGARGEVVNTMIKAFNDSQSDYVVVGSYKGGYDETVNAGVAAYRAKKQPHLLQSFEVGTQTMMLSGAIYPVYKLMKDEGYNIDWKGYLQPVLSYYMNANGDLMSMPFNSSTPVMYYNADLFKKAGLPMLDKSKPVTWDEMGEITAKLVNMKLSNGLTFGWQSWTQVENYSAIHNTAFASKSNGYEGLDCELLINNPMVVKHIAMLKEWMKDGRFFYGGQKFAGPKAEFLAQNAAIYIDSISAIAKLQAAVKDFKWDAAPMAVVVCVFDVIGAYRKPAPGEFNGVLHVGWSGDRAPPDGAHRAAHLDARILTFLDTSFRLFPVDGQCGS